MAHPIAYIQDNLALQTLLNKPGILIYSEEQPNLNLLSRAIGSNVHKTFATFTQLMNKEVKAKDGELLVITNLTDNCIFEDLLKNNNLIISELLYHPSISQYSDINFEKKFNLTKNDCKLMSQGYQKLRETINCNLEIVEEEFFTKDGQISNISEFDQYQELFIELVAPIFINIINTNYLKDSILWILPLKVVQLLYKDNPHYGLYSVACDGLGIYSLEDQSKLNINPYYIKLSKAQIFDKYRVLLEAFNQV
jgi:hypothetical protein